jgi:glycosyltransferase involved in cell wall biosynthesis
VCSIIGYMSFIDNGRSCVSNRPNDVFPPIVIASILREDGITGVQSYVQRLRQYLAECAIAHVLITPFSWGSPLTIPVFGVRFALKRFSGSASTVWYRHWHEAFLRNALRRHLAEIGDCIVYAQCPLAARAALQARQGAHQRVVLAVHFRISQADEWANKRQIKHGGPVFRAIRQLEREVIPQVDGLVYVSRWARDALLDWLPEADKVSSAVIGCMVTPLRGDPVREPLGDLVTIGNLDIVKNHRFLLKVLAEANRAGRPLTLDIFGEGPLRKELLGFTQSLGLEKQVRFHGFRRDARNLLPGYRAYVHACYSESFCLAIVEAMAAGLPVVAGDIGPISELFEDGIEGRYWPLEDPAQAAAMLIGLLDSEPARLKAASAAKNRFLLEFDADLIVPRLLSFLLDNFWESDPGGGPVSQEITAADHGREDHRVEQPTGEYHQEPGTFR